MNVLDGKRALVTGAGGRLGPIWMQALADAGATVLGVDVDDYDLSQAMACWHLVADHPDVDILVNNAGVDSRPDMDAGQAQAMVDVNLLGTKRLCHEYGQLMAGRGGGVIVNIASLYGLVVPDLRYYDHRPDGWVKDSIYGATKAAVISLTQYYAAKHGKDGVRVNALAPGGVVAGDDALTKQDPEFVKKYTARIPMGRMATPEDLGGPLVFLASDMSRFITGVTIPIEGGVSVLLVIPARAGSKRVNNKALRPFAGGASLLQRAIERAGAAGYDPVVATESDAIAAAAEDMDVRVMKREPWTAEDRSPDYTWAKMLPVTFPDERVFAILRITSPFLAASHADRMLELLANESRTSMRCVTPAQQHPGKMWIFGEGIAGVPVYQGEVETLETWFTPYHSTPTQELPPVYLQTAGLEVTTADTLRHSLAGNRVGLYVVTGWEALDINTPDDWERAEAYVRSTTV